ncbi:MAG: hypothetical protein AAFR88_09385 [Pseudomonadota bacterium]
MTKTDLKMIEQLNERLYAIQQLTLSLGVALAQSDPEAGLTSHFVASGQADSLLNKGRPLAAHHLTRLLEDIEQCVR